MSTNSVENEIDLFAVAGTLWRGKLIILVFCVLTLGASLYYTSEIATPRYSSTTTLAVQERQPSLVDIESFVSGVSSETEALNTEIEVLRSRDLLERVVRKLNLVSDPEFNPSVAETSRFQILDFMKNLLGLEDDLETSESALNAAVESLGDRFTATVKRQTFVISLTVETEGAQKSQTIANTIAELYLEDQVRVKFATLDEGATWLSERVVELEKELQAKDEEFKARSAAADYVNIEGLELMNRQVREVRERLLGEQADAERAFANFVLFQELVSARLANQIVDLTRDPVLIQLTREMQESDLWSENSAFLERVKELEKRARTDVDRAQTQVDALTASMTNLESRVDQQAGMLSELQQLQREIDTISILYETFLTRLRETTIQQGVQSADARVLSTAITGEKIAPRTTMLAALSLVFGTVLGCGFVLIREMQSRGFRNAEDLQGLTGISVIGQIPLFPIKKRNELLRYLREKPTSAAVEAVRNLRTSILLSDFEKSPKLIMSTSTLPGEGKTTQSISLAQNLSGLGKKVLLIEGDVRRRTLDEYFTLKDSGNSILSVVAGDIALEEAAFYSEAIGVHILGGEKSARNAADLFSSKQFENFLEEARSAFDFVIIDTPPVLVVPDSRVIGQYCDATIYSVKWDSTRKAQVLAGLNELNDVNVKVTGLVLSQIDPVGMKRYGFGDRNGTYSTTYGSDYYDS